MWRGGGRMKIVDRKTFLAMPSGTVYSLYAPCVFEQLQVKSTDCGDNDWIYCNLISPLHCDSTEHFLLNCEEMERGGSVPLDFSLSERDGCFEKDQLFAVWEESDVSALIARLREALGGK